MQGSFRVAAANSLYAKAEIAYDELNRVNGQGSFVAGFVYSSTFCDEFNVKNSICEKLNEEIPSRKILEGCPPGSRRMERKIELKFLGTE